VIIDFGIRHLFDDQTLDMGDYVGIQNPKLDEVLSENLEDFEAGVIPGSLPKLDVEVVFNDGS
jgi:hypothetical protein